MIDKNFKPWLIEINTNPSLDCYSPLLNRIIPYMVEQSLKLSLDLAYPPPTHYPNTAKHLAPLINLETFKYELIFDSQTEGEQLRNLYRRVKNNLSKCDVMQLIKSGLSRTMRSSKTKGRSASSTTSFDQNPDNILMYLPQSNIMTDLSCLQYCLDVPDCQGRRQLTQTNTLNEQVLPIQCHLNKRIKLSLNIISMDPRPYHFEYRRPRYANPT